MPEGHRALARREASWTATSTAPLSPQTDDHDTAAPARRPSHGDAPSAQHRRLCADRRRRQHPACVRRSPGKENGDDLKPFIAFQRVRLPPGKGAARQPEASLAWVVATPLVKRRQRTPKPGVEPRYHVHAGAFGVLDPGAASVGPQMARSCPIRPGSESRAEVWDGTPGNLRYPVRAHVQTAGTG